MPSISFGQGRLSLSFSPGHRQPSCRSLTRLRADFLARRLVPIPAAALPPLALAAAALFGGAAPVLAQGAVKALYGDWEMRCETPPGAQSEQCAISQFVQAEDRDGVGLNVFVFTTADRQARLLRVFAPLGVFLPAGLGLRIDDANIGMAGFVRCLPEGCMAEAIIDDELLAKLRSGGTATFIVFETPEEGIGIPISLTGFGEGFDALP